MSVSIDLATNYLVKDGSPDFHFTIMENGKQGSHQTIDVIYDSKLKRLKTVGYTPTILAMNNIASNALQIIDPNIYFSPDFPEFLLPKDDPRYNLDEYGDIAKRIITWGVVRKEPGTVSGTPFRGTREIRPRSREFIAVIGSQYKQYLVGDTVSVVEKDKNIVKFLKVKGQFFDNLVQYNMWSKSNYQVEELTEWFEQFMLDYTGMFREAGINNMYFDRRVRDDVLIQMKNYHHVRSVLYYVRTERISIEAVLPIRRINLDVDVTTLNSNNIDTLNIDSDLYDNIVSRWVNKSN